MPKKWTQHMMRQRAVQALYHLDVLDSLAQELARTQKQHEAEVAKLEVKLGKTQYFAKEDDREAAHEIADLGRRIEIVKKEIEEDKSVKFDRDLDSLKNFVINYDNETDEPYEVPDYFSELLDGVQTNQSQLDQVISEHLAAGWSFSRLTLIERNLLRLGAYEIQFSETPDLVALNEAIELAKDFSDEKSSKFINGVLTHLIKK